MSWRRSWASIRCFDAKCRRHRPREAGDPAITDACDFH
jgi:hypothetical protein